MRFLKVVLAVGTALSTLPAAAFAQVSGHAAQAANPSDPAGQGATLEEIVVTAQKRSESIRDVPLAITAMGGDALKAAGVADTAGLQRVVPGFNVQTTHYGNPVFFIRGVGFTDPTPTVSPAVSVYLDQVPLPYSIMSRGAVLDLERVEVLKGPQGTLFGENSTGGAINFIAAKPTHTLQEGAELSYGRFNSLDVNGFVSGPITDTLGIRVAGRVEHQGDWQYSTSRDDARGQKKFFNGRIVLEWEPADPVDIRFTAQAWRDRSDVQAPQYTFFIPQASGPGAYPVATAALANLPPAPSNSRAADWDPGSPKAQNNEFYQTALEGNFRLPGSLLLTSITAYSNMTSYQPMDIDGTSYTDIFSEQHVRISSVYQELRLSGTAGRATWMVGGNFQHDQTHNLLEVETGTTSSNIAGRHFTFVNNIGDSPSINTYGVFGSVDYKITDTVTARGSARYTSVSNQHEGCTADSGRGDLAAAFAGLSSLLSGSPTTIASGQCVTLDATTFKPAGLIKQKLDEHNVSWRVGLDWKVTPDALLYANIAKGYKSGAWTNTAAALSSQIAPVKQESILAYEAGLKSTFARDRLQLNLSAFYYDYTNKQLGGYVNVPPFGALPTLVSIPKSKVYGAEAQIDALLTPLLKAQLSAAYTYTRVQADPELPIDPFGNPTSFVGESFPQTPRYQLNLNVEQTIPVSDRLEGYVGGDVAYRSSASSTFGRDSSQLSREVFSLPGYTLLGLRAGVRFDHGKTGLEIWGHNVTDTFYTSSIVKPGDAVVRFVGFPRTFGIRLYWRN